MINTSIHSTSAGFSRASTSITASPAASPATSLATSREERRCHDSEKSTSQRLRARVPTTQSSGSLIKNTAEACAKSGMPEAHAQCFQNVANKTQCVIANRAVGKHATGLIRENYASKGFHVKAKSCDWGPMAGFVLSDPRFTKAGTSRNTVFEQAKAIRNAKESHNAGEMPVYISDKRRQELIGLECMKEVFGEETPETGRIVYSAISPDNKEMKFVLKKVTDAPGAEDTEMWGLYYHPTEKPLFAKEVDHLGKGSVAGAAPEKRDAAENSSSAKEEGLVQEPSSAPLYKRCWGFLRFLRRHFPGSTSNQDTKIQEFAINDEELIPVMALVDPLCPEHIKTTYRAAMTGDYDLWGVMPKAQKCPPQNLNTINEIDALPPVEQGEGTVPANSESLEVKHEESADYLTRMQAHQKVADSAKANATQPFDPNGLDKRLVTGSSRSAVPMQRYIAEEDPDKGNTTRRIASIADMLNAEFRTAGYAGGQMVHHSDEVGRPMVDAVEYHFIAFIPGEKQALYVENDTAFRKFVDKITQAGYQLTINPGWAEQLGIEISHAENWTMDPNYPDTSKMPGSQPQVRRMRTSV